MSNSIQNVSIKSEFRQHIGTIQNWLKAVVITLPLLPLLLILSRNPDPLPVFNCNYSDTVTTSYSYFNCDVVVGYQLHQSN